MTGSHVAAGIMAAARPTPPPIPTVTITPSSVSANGAATPPYIGQTPICTAAGSGTTPPYTYYWQQVSSAGVTFWIYDGTDQSSDWSTQPVVTWTFASNVPGHSTWQCTVTDAKGMQGIGYVSVHANGG